MDVQSFDVHNIYNRLRCGYYTWLICIKYRNVKLYSSQFM